MAKKSWTRRAAVLFAAVLVVTSCGGNSEPSGRQRNTAIACVSATVEGALQLGTSGGDAVVNVGACTGTVSLEFLEDGRQIGAPAPFSDGGTVPLTVTLPAIAAGSTESVKTFTVRATGADQVVLAEDVLTVRLNETGDVSVAVTAGTPTTTPETTSQPQSSALAPVTNLAMTYTATSGDVDLYTLSFEYPDEELARVVGFETERKIVGAADDTLVRSSMVKSLFTRGGENRLETRISGSAGMFTRGATYEFLLTPYVAAENDPDRPVPDTTATVGTTFVAGGTSEQTPQEPGASVGRDPVPPTDLAMADSTDALTWVPGRPSTNGHQFNTDTYPYRYRVSWRQSGTTDGFSNFADALETQLGWADSQTEAAWFTPDTAYEFIVEEHLYGADGEFVSSSAPSVALVATPYTAEEFANDEAERVAREKASREAAAECLKTAPQLELLLVDPENRQGDPTAPVTSDDKVKFGLLHPCAKDTVARLVFSVREIDPVNKRVFWKDVRWGAEDVLEFRVPQDRLSPGAHTVVVEASWYLNDQPNDGGGPLPVASTEWTFEVAQGTEPFPQRCFADKFSVSGRTLTIDCDVTNVRWRNSPISSRSVGFSDDKRTVTLPVFPDGWNRFGLRVTQSVYGSTTFDFMVCQRNCDNPKLEPEFSVALEGDTANISVTQNSCGGNPRARISEYVKISDNLYYSYNRAFGESTARVNPDAPLALALKPFTSALGSERRDFCGQRRATVYSFTTLARTSVKPLALENMPPVVQTEVIVEPVDVISAERPVVQVPASADTLVVSDDILTALARTGGTVTVRIDDGEPEEIVAAKDLALELPRGAKRIIFRATDRDGRVSEVSKPIMQVSEPEKVEVLVEEAGETVPQAEPSQGGSAGGSGSRTGLFVGIAALLVALLAAAALVGRRRKAVG